MWRRVLAAVLLCSCITNSECSARKKSIQKSCFLFEFAKKDQYFNIIGRLCDQYYYFLPKCSSDFQLFSRKKITVEKKFHCFVP